VGTCVQPRLSLAPLAPQTLARTSTQAAAHLHRTFLSSATITATHRHGQPDVQRARSFRSCSFERCFYNLETPQARILKGSPSLPQASADWLHLPG